MIYNKKGFTLVELSIVLVIIGLLIGGILVGQSLIESAKIQGYVKKIQQWEIAFDLFKSKFGQFPGDTDLMAPAGNNDGMINTIVACKGVYSGDEQDYAMYHMSVTEMINIDLQLYSPVRCGGSHPNLAAPATAAENEFTPGIGYNSSTWQTAVNGLTPGIAIGIVTTPNSFTPPSSSFAAGQVYVGSGADIFSVISMDKKMDDGVSDTGNFFAVDIVDWVTACDDVISTPTDKICYFEHYWKR